MCSGVATEFCANIGDARHASAIAAGPMALSVDGAQESSVVRFMKSSTDRPEENRAVRAVGRTWLGPAM